MSDGLTLEKLKIEERLRSVEQTLAGQNQTLSGIVTQLIELNNKVGIQNGRVRKLEDWKVYVFGGVCALSGIVGASVTVINLLK